MGVDDYGADPSPVPGPHPAKRKKQKIGFGSATESEVEIPRRSISGTTRVVRRFQELWSDVVIANPDYVMYKSVDVRRFSGYLTDTFLGEKAKTPLSPEQVILLVEQFMLDLSNRRFTLKPGQPAWLSFTARWHKHPPETRAVPDSREFRGRGLI